MITRTVCSSGTDGRDDELACTEDTSEDMRVGKIPIESAVTDEFASVWKPFEVRPNESSDSSGR